MKTIIRATPNPSGAYPGMQTWNSPFTPTGYYVWAEGLEKETFFEYNGFVNLNIMRNTVVSYEPNVEAYEAWKESAGSGGDGGDAPDVPGGTAAAQLEENTEILNILLGVTE